MTCSGASCCCTDGGCRCAEANCQSDTWYFNTSSSSTITCTPCGCDNPCTINSSVTPVLYVNANKCYFCSIFFFYIFCPWLKNKTKKILSVHFLVNKTIHAFMELVIIILQDLAALIAHAQVDTLVQIVNLVK